MGIGVDYLSAFLQQAAGITSRMTGSFMTRSDELEYPDKLLEWEGNAQG